MGTGRGWWNHLGKSARKIWKNGGDSAGGLEWTKVAFTCLSDISVGGSQWLGPPTLSPHVVSIPHSVVDLRYLSSIHDDSGLLVGMNQVEAASFVFRCCKSSSIRTAMLYWCPREGYMGRTTKGKECQSFVGPCLQTVISILKSFSSFPKGLILILQRLEK